MRMAYDRSGQLMIDNGLGWNSAQAAPVLPAPFYDPALAGDCGCNKTGLGQAQTGTAWIPIVLALGGLWAVSALLAPSHRRL